MGNSTNNENKKVGLLSEWLAIICGYNKKEAQTIGLAGVLHDIGKLYTPHHILDKPGKLTNDEFNTIKLHTLYGYNLLSNMLDGDYKEVVKTVALYHHEHYDGNNGYWGIAAKHLPLYVNIVSICDVFCALLEKRCYKNQWPPEEVMAYICSKSGTQFDPFLVRQFIQMMHNDTN